MIENRISAKFEQLKSEGRKAFVSYVMGADPDAKTTVKIMHEMVASGVNIIELGLPFSDPMAEGPTIQKAAKRVLDTGIKQLDILKIVAEFRKQDVQTPVILMGYYNPIQFIGLDKFVSKAKNAGVDGFIIVDLPPEEDSEFIEVLVNHNISFIKLTTPTTIEGGRAEKIMNNASGFVYYISVAGVTGVKSADYNEVEQNIKALKKHTDLPICIGFGIKTPEQAAKAAKIADGVVIGSAFVKIIEDNFEDTKEIVSQTAKFTKEITTAIS